MPAVGEPLELNRLLSCLVSRPNVALNCVPALWETLIDIVESGAGPTPVTLRRLLLGGEDLSEALVARTYALFPEVQLWNLYGPTEATVNALAARVVPGREVSIGRPVGGVEALVLDGDGADSPVGVAGELYLGGLALARGYRDDPVGSTAAFGPHSHHPDRRLYRTGDRVLRLADGQIRFLGRSDDQVKLSGLRVELEEIAALLRKHATVREAAVVMRAGRPAAYLVAAGTAPAVDELRAHLGDHLPPAVIPASFTFLNVLPRTSAGKLDRAALPSPAPESPRLTRPASGTERRVAGVWSALLDRPAIASDTSFFELGGHSLLLVRAHARLRPLAPTLTIVDLFRYPTVRTLARRIDALSSTVGTVRA